MHNTAGEETKVTDEIQLIHTTINHAGLFRAWIPLQQELCASLPSSFDPHFQSQNQHFPFQLSSAPLLPRHLPHHFPARVGCPRCPMMMMQAKQIQGRCNKSAFAAMNQQMLTDREVLLQVCYRRHEGCFGFPTSLRWTLSFCWASHIGLGTFQMQKGPWVQGMLWKES